MCYAAGVRPLDLLPSTARILAQRYNTNDEDVLRAFARQHERHRRELVTMLRLKRNAMPVIYSGLENDTIAATKIGNNTPNMFSSPTPLSGDQLASPIPMATSLARHPHRGTSDGRYTATNFTPSYIRTLQSTGSGIAPSLSGICFASPNFSPIFFEHSFFSLSKERGYGMAFIQTNLWQPLHLVPLRWPHFLRLMITL